MDSVELWSGKDRPDENFPVGSWLIRRDLRAHVHAFYAFARNADDIADSAQLSAEDKIARLNVMEAVLLGSRDGGSPSAAGLRVSLAQTGVSAAHACDLLRAFRRDATKTRYANWNELYDYCRFSAMPVGRHVLDLHGEAPRTHAPSDALCVALQVLNHLQDCARDLAALDRCYLPADRLAKHGAAVTDLQRPVETPGLRRVFGELLDHVDALNKTAASLPGGVRDWRLRVETAGIVNLSRALATRLRRGDPLATRVKLSRGDMVFSLATAMKSLL